MQRANMTEQEYALACKYVEVFHGGRPTLGEEYLAQEFAVEMATVKQATAKDLEDRLNVWRRKWTKYTATPRALRRHWDTLGRELDDASKDNLLYGGDHGKPAATGRDA